jgi:hypothetical protein
MDAETARKLAGVPDEDFAKEQVSKVEKDIENAAKSKKRMVYLTDRFWASGGYNVEPTWKLATEMLRKRGFTVKFRYEERQFVDMGTEVHW